MRHPLVAGMWEDRSMQFSAYLSGTGWFLGKFDLAFVLPAMLAMFGPGPGIFSPQAAVFVTSERSSFNGTTR
jgi:hypothetical protein